MCVNEPHMTFCVKKAASSKRLNLTNIKLRCSSVSLGKYQDMVTLRGNTFLKEVQ